MKVELTFDEFFKQGSSAFFRYLGFQVETEFELFKLPKKLDLLIIKADEVRIPDNFELLTYFKNHNLVSFKSPGDRIKERDIREAIIYLNGYVNAVKDSDYENTTMTILCNHEPKKFLNKNRESITEIASGHRLIDYSLFQIHLINLNLTEYSGLEAFFLKEFAETESLQEAVLESSVLKQLSDEKMLDIVKELLYIRNRSFENNQMQGVNMPATLKADITELVRPHYEDGLEKGLEKGLQEGEARGEARGEAKGELKKALETARNLIKRGFSTADICDITGLTETQLKEHGVIGR